MSIQTSRNMTESDLYTVPETPEELYTEDLERAANVLEGEENVETEDGIEIDPKEINENLSDKEQYEDMFDSWENYEEAVGLWRLVYGEGADPIDPETAVGKGWEDKYEDPFTVGRIKLKSTDGSFGEYKDDIFLEYVITNDDDQNRKFRFNTRSGDMERAATNNTITAMEDRLEEAGYPVEEVAGTYKSTFGTEFR